MFVIACGLATKLNKCRCKSRVIFTAAARILIFTAQVGLIVQCICIYVYLCTFVFMYCVFSQRLQEYWSSRLKWVLLCELIPCHWKGPLYTNLSHTCVFVFVHFSPGTHLHLHLFRTSLHTNLSLLWSTSTHPQLKRKESTFCDPNSKQKCSRVSST